MRNCSHIGYAEYTKVEEVIKRIVKKLNEVKVLNDVKVLFASPNNCIEPGRLSNNVQGSSLAFYSKRVVDVVGAVVGLLLLSPLLLLVALAIRLDSAGPVFYIQERVGARQRTQRGRVAWETCTFRLYKFRSMVHNADESIHQAHIKAFVAGQTEVAEADDAKFKLKNDFRITRVGKLLRRTSLDELPQLLNVLKGEMSLVGPRPVPVYEVAEYEPWHHERLLALPGITGLWQVKGRGRVTFDEMVRMDIEYTRTQSLWLDLQLLCLTIPSVLSGRGAK